MAAKVRPGSAVGQKLGEILPRVRAVPGQALGPAWAKPLLPMWLGSRGEAPVAAREEEKVPAWRSAAPQQELPPQPQLPPGNAGRGEVAELHPSYDVYRTSREQPGNPMVPGEAAPSPAPLPQVRPQPPRPESAPVEVDPDVDGLGTLKKAFPDIARAHELGSQASYDGHRITRGGKEIARVIRKQGGAPAVELNSGNGPGLWDKTVLGGGGKDAAVYLGMGGRDRKTPEKAREWKSQLIGAMAKGPAPGVAARMDTPEGRAQLERSKELERLGGLPDQIRGAVKRGDLPLGDGEEMMKKLWGKTLKPQDPRSEDNFREWILAQPEEARKAWFGAVSMGDVEAQNGLMNHYVNDWYVKNSNQPGVTRDLMQRVREDLTGKDAASFKEKFTAKVNGLNEFAASMVGSSAGMVGGLAEDEWNARLAPFSAKARAKLKEKMEIRGRGTKNWWRGAQHFVDKNNPLSDTGRKDREAQYALGDLKRAIDVLDLQQNGWKAEDQKKIGEAMAAAREKVFALHEVDQEKGFEIRRDDVDAAKDPELFQALNDYVQTGDPNAWQRFRDRMFADQGMRQLDKQMNEKLKGMNPWQAAFTGGANASYAELGIEAAGMALTAGLGKALGAEVKLIKAAQGAGKGAARGGGALARMGAIGRGLAGAGEELGGFHRLGKSLVPSGRLGKAVKHWVKETALEAPVGAATEAITEAGDKRATGDSMLKAAGMGLVGEMVMGPAMAGTMRVLKEGAKLLPARKSDAEFADYHRGQMAGNPEARELSQEDLDAATGPMDAERHQAIVAEFEAGQREQEAARAAAEAAAAAPSTTPVGDAGASGQQAGPEAGAGSPSAEVAPAPQGESLAGEAPPRGGDTAGAGAADTAAGEAEGAALFPGKSPAPPAEVGRAPRETTTNIVDEPARRGEAPQDPAAAEIPPGDATELGGSLPPTPEAVDSAAKAPDARKRLGDVRAGSLHALEAYRFFNDKLEAKGRLSPEEQVTYDRATRALAEAVGRESRTADTTTPADGGTRAWRREGSSSQGGLADGPADAGRGEGYGADVPSPSRPGEAAQFQRSMETAPGTNGTGQAFEMGRTTSQGEGIYDNARQAGTMVSSTTTPSPSRQAAPGTQRSQVTRADVQAAATAPDARKRWGMVRAGTLHALEAYRFLSDKLRKMGRLDPAEKVTYERAAQALAEAVGKSKAEAAAQQGGLQESRLAENYDTSELERYLAEENPSSGFRALADQLLNYRGKMAEASAQLDQRASNAPRVRAPDSGGPPDIRQYLEWIGKAKSAKESVIESCRALLGAASGSKTTITFHGDARLLNLAREGAALASRYVRADLLPTTLEVIYHSDTRARHRPGRIYFNEFMTPLEIAHEIMHEVELINGRANLAAWAFLRMRAETGGMASLAEATGLDYTSSEMAWLDRWREKGGDAYSGKICPDIGDRHVTEILTVGLERLHRNPLLFLLRDPEYFDFVVRTIHDR